MMDLQALAGMDESVSLFGSTIPPETIILWVTVVVIAVGYFFPPAAAAISAAGIHEFHFLGIVFALLVALMLIIGALKPRAEPWHMVCTKEVDLTPWKGAQWASLILVFLVIAIYVFFAI